MRRSRAFFASLALCAFALTSAAFSQSQPPANAVSASGAISPSGGNVTITGLLGQNRCTIDVTGTWSGALTLQISTSWQTLVVSPYGSSSTQSTISADGLYYAATPATSQVRVIGPTSSGTASVYLNCVYYAGAIGSMDVEPPLFVANGRIGSTNSTGAVESGSAVVTADGSAATTVTFPVSFSGTPSIVGNVVYATPPPTPWMVSVQFTNCTASECDLWAYGGNGPVTVSWVATVL